MTWNFNLFGINPLHSDTVWFRVFYVALQSSLLTSLLVYLFRMAIITAVNFERKFTSASILPSHHVNDSLWDTGISASQPKGPPAVGVCAIGVAVCRSKHSWNRRRKLKVEYDRKERQIRFHGDLTTKLQEIPNYALKIICLNHSPVTGRLSEGDSH